MTNLDSILNKLRHYFATKSTYNQSYGFSSSHVWMRELNYKESWAPKNWCFWTVVLKTLERPLDCKEIQPVNPKGNQSWIFTGRTDTEAETPMHWPPGGKTWLIGKDPDAGKDWKQEEKGTREDEMVGWHHRLNKREFEQALGVGDGQGSLACCSPWGHKESDMTEQLNWTDYCTSIAQVFLDSSVGQESTCNAGYPWRRERLSTPVFWPGKFHGWYRSMGLQRVGHDWATFTLITAWFLCLHSHLCLCLPWHLVAPFQLSQATEKTKEESIL